MIVVLESTTKIVELNGVPARIWEGHTNTGIPVHAYITRIAIDKKEDDSQFQKELMQCIEPSEEIKSIPLRMIL